MSTRERWIVYPLLFLALGTAIKPKLVPAERVSCRHLEVVDEKLEPVKKKVDDLKAESDRKIAEARARLDEEKKKLEERLKALSGGVNLPRLPGRPPE